MDRKTASQQHRLQVPKLSTLKTDTLHVCVQHLAAHSQLPRGRISLGSTAFTPDRKKILATAADLGGSRAGGTLFVFIASWGGRLMHGILCHPLCHVFHPRVLHSALYLRVLHCGP